MTEVLTRMNSPRRSQLASDVEAGPQAFSKAEIAGLSIGEVHAMGEDDLVRVVHCAHLPCLDRETLGRLQFFDRETLERIVFLARRTCRNQGY